MNYWLWLASLESSENSKTKELYNVLKEPERIYKADKKELMKVNGMDEETSEFILKNKDEELISRMEVYMKKNSIHQISLCDKDYPISLKSIFDPPITLFYKGDISLVNKKCVSVIGSRKPSFYGIDMAFKIGKDLAKKGCVVISGLAEGIDAESHKGALYVNGKTIAVVGTGLDRVYPSKNHELCKKIEREGLVISEYVVGTKPLPSNFPKRNRIISGLSDDLIVVEAAEKSGALITVDTAIEQGKNVYAVPRKYRF